MHSYSYGAPRARQRALAAKIAKRAAPPSLTLPATEPLSYTLDDLRPPVSLSRSFAVDLKPRLEKQLKQARELSEGLLSAFETPEQWTHQVHTAANHAL